MATENKSRLKAKPPEEAKAGKTKLLIFGPSGVGKSWFSLDFPSVYYIDTEGGARQDHYRTKLVSGGGVYMGPDEGSLDFATVLEQFQALATEEHGFKTIVIDSITKLFQTSIAQEAEKLGDKDAFGASKKPAIAMMRRLVNWTQRVDLNVCFVAHEGTEWGQDPKTGQRTEIGKTPDVWDKLVYELDLTLHARRQGNSRVAQVKKSRLTGFIDGEVFPLDFTDFAKRFGADAIEGAVKRIQLATVDQVAEITRLLAVLNISPAETEKILTKAAADNWSELSTEQAASTITWLKKKLA